MDRKRERDRQTDRQTERERMGFGRRMMKDLRAKIIEIRKGNGERGKGEKKTTEKTKNEIVRET